MQVRLGFFDIALPVPIVAKLTRPTRKAPMSNFVHGLGVSLAGVMTNATGACPKAHRPTRVLHSNEDSAKAAGRPRDICLDATAQHGPVAPLVVACHEAGLRELSLIHISE